MSFIVGSNTVASSNGVVMPRFASNGRPSTPANGQVIYNTSTSTMEIYDGGQWREVSSARPFLLRQVITKGYVLGGYKDSTPWRNVNRMVHATDVMTNLGDQIDSTHAYTSAGTSLTKAFVFCGTGMGSGTTTSVFVFATETSGGTGSAARVSRDMLATCWKEHYYIYIMGGGSGDVDVFNTATEVMMQDLGVDTAGTGNMSSVNDEFAGWTWTDDAGFRISFGSGVNYRVDTGVVRAAHSQQRGVNSKIGRGWCGNEGSYNGGYNFRRWNLATETNLGTTAKPHANSGEENLDMGQAHQYCHGQYDGAQNNRSWKFTYATETGVELGAGSTRTGVPGGSSAGGSWTG